ncbi:MAG: Asp23/Gls24 family envelope stress response protein [Chloroflexota bacterium]
MIENLGSVRVSPSVLAAIARLTTLDVPGVSRMSNGLVGGMSRLIGRENQAAGVKLQVTEGVVTVDLHVVIKSGFNMLDVGTRIQEDVNMALSKMVGMPVGDINIYVEDVE